MPALNITAVTAGTDQLTITAHGLNTGDGPAAMYTADGVLPGGTAAVTDYWIIRDDADKVRLATSSTNAMAGTAIDITDAGSGTLQLLIGVPFRRPRTYGVGSQLKSDDLNAFSDTFVALWNLLTGQAQSVFSDAIIGLRSQIVIEPPALTANTNNWNPSGLNTAEWIRADTDGVGNTWNLTGISAPSYDGKQLLLTCIGASAGIIALQHEDANSSAANRFIIPGGTFLEVAASDTVTFRYDATVQRWRVVSSQI